MFHLKPGSDFRADLSAVMLADGEWYSVYDPTLPNGGEYLSFLQYPDGREQRAVMVNVSLADIKAVAYFGLPNPGPAAGPDVRGTAGVLLGSAQAGEEMVINGVGKLPAQPFAWQAVSTSGDLPDLGDLKAGRIYVLPEPDETVGMDAAAGEPLGGGGQIVVVAGTVEDARDIARILPGRTVPVSPRSIRHGALRGRTSTGVVIDASVHPLDRDLLDELTVTTLGATSTVQWWIRRVTGTGVSARWGFEQWHRDE